MRDFFIEVFCEAACCAALLTFLCALLWLTEA